MLMFAYFTDLHVDLLSKALLQPGEQRVGQSVVRYLPWWALGFINKTYLVIATDQRIILIEHRMAFFHQAQKLHSVQSIPWSSVQEARVTGLFRKKLRVRGQAQTGPIGFKADIPNHFFGLLAPMRGNMPGARAIAAAFAQLGRPATLPPQPMPQALPPGYGAPPGYAAPPAYAPPPGSVSGYPQAPAVDPTLQSYGAPSQPQPQPYYPQPQQPQQYPQSYPRQQAAAFAPTEPVAVYAQPHSQQQTPPSIPPLNAPGYQSSPPPPVAPSVAPQAFYSTAGGAGAPPPPMPRASGRPLPPPLPPRRA
jgi:hypothetical protein